MGHQQVVEPGLRVGVIGAGVISHLHLPGWLALGADVRLFSIGGGPEVAATYGVDLAGSVEELLAWADVVDICTPTGTHPQLALAAIAAGVHVICEKPLALTTAQAARMAQAAQAAGVALIPAHVVRYFPQYAAMAGAVRAGRIGELAVARFTRTGVGPGADTWFGSIAASGGVLMDLMIHDLDQARWIGGEVAEVYAVQNPRPDGDRVPPVVTAHVLLTHRGGAISHVLGSWGRPGTIFRTSFDIAGAAGTMHHDTGEDRVLVTDLPIDPGASTIVPATPLYESPYTTQIRDFAAAITTGSTPRVSAADGVAAVALARAAARSLASGRPERPRQPTVPAR